MTVQGTTLRADWHPLLEQLARQGNNSLAGRLALLSGLFGIFLVVALWSGADTLPRSTWQQLGLASDAPLLRRVDVSDAAALTEVFDEHGYRLASLRAAPAGGVPRLAVASLPRDLAAIEDAGKRKALFLRTLLPLVLQVNAELRQTRVKVIDALNAQAEGRLSVTDSLWLEAVTEWYGAAPGDAADLLSRIDVVPPSLALAQAAQESGWGTSRFAQNANALYGQRAWGAEAEGLKPTDAERQDFRVRSFPDLLSAVRSYLHNLNSHRAYAELRDRRARARAMGQPLNALNLVGGLKSYSEEGKAYVLALSRLIESNELQAFDGTRLRPRR